MSDTASDVDLTAIERERTRIRETHLKPSGERPASSARGLHHTALISSDVSGPSASTRTSSASR